MIVAKEHWCSVYILSLYAYVYFNNNIFNSTL